MKKSKKMIVTTLVVLSILVVIGLTKLVVVRAATATAVDLGSILTNNFVILSKTGITNVPTSVITGNIGTSLDQPDTGIAFAGITCPQVTGSVYSFNSTGPLSPCLNVDATLIGNAVSDMEAAYTFASLETAGAGDFSNVGTGTLSGQTFVPGVYTWNSNVTIAEDITIAGGANDIWVFQVNGILQLNGTKKIILSGGAQAKNIFWQVTGYTELFAGSTFEGNILDQTLIAMDEGAILHGRALAQTAVTLIGNTISGQTALHLRKIVTNDNGGTALNTAWTLTATGATSTPTSFSGTTPVDSDSTFKADTYTLSESGPSGYASSTICVNNITSATTTSNIITLATGDDVTCTITNNDIAPKLHLIKVITGGTATFADFTLTANGTGSNDFSGTSPVNSGVGLLADTFALSETNPGGYTASAWSCVGGTQDGSNITLGINQEATCTITNTYIPPTPSGGGGMTYNNPTCTDVTYSPVYSDACFGGYQYSEVVSRTPAGCSLTAAQIEASRRVCIVVYPIATTTPVVVAPVITTSTPLPITPPATFVPKLPNTGIFPVEGNTPWNLFMFTGVLLLISTSLIFVIKKRTN